jgi:hypothetical protein
MAVTRWWDSASTTRHLARTATLTAIVALTIAFGSWPFTLVIAVPGFVIGASAVTCAVFSWFRAEHLDAVQSDGGM